MPIPRLDSAARVPCTTEAAIVRNAQVTIVNLIGVVAECDGRRALGVNAYDGVDARFGIQGEGD